MKAGSGVIHDETLNPDPETHVTQPFKFWINLPAKNKVESTQYLAIQADEVPLQILDNGNGWRKVIVGEYEGLNSKFPNFPKQFLYHVHLGKGGMFSLKTLSEFEYAALLENYTGPIVAESPFIMNTTSEIAKAYHDFHAGKYGEISYNQ